MRSYDKAAAFFAVPTDTVRQAMARVASGEVEFVVLSGKMASGKDSVAPAWLDRHGFRDRTHHYYALPLKAETDAIIGTIRETIDGSLIGTGEAAARVAALHNMRLDQAAVLVDVLAPLILADPGLHSRKRPNGMRKALQFHGTDVRRAQDPDYWVRLALAPAIRSLANGQSVFLTDARFPNEIDAAAQLHATGIRLDISRETQAARLAARDGNTAPDPELFFHESETALDDYQGFTVRVDNNGTLAECLNLIDFALSQDTAGAQR